MVRPAPQRNVFLGGAAGARPFYAREGEIGGAVLVFRDITARKKYELALKSTDQLRDFIFQSNLSGVAHTVADGRFIDCNDALVRMLGYSSVEEPARHSRAATLLRPSGARPAVAPRQRPA